MAVNSKKISGLTTISNLPSDAYLMVAYNNKSYKVSASLFTNDIIKNITQKINSGDGADNPITITTNDSSSIFHVYNGAKGSKGDTGDKGAKGDIGDTTIALYNKDVTDLILDTLNGKSKDGSVVYTEEELAQLILSAAQGVELNNQLEKLDEEYLTQEEYDNKVAENKISSTTKYFILEES